MRTKSANELLICVSLFLLAVSSTHSRSVQAQAGSGWTKSGSNPVLSPGPLGVWDDENVADPCVIRDASTYKMWYSGFDGGSWRIGYATSSDGITWTKHPGNPVLDLGTSGSWDDAGVSTPWVIKEDSTYMMWYE
nr:hypothetical protein [Candidatus Njordarchaeum guaymaensis]